MIQATVMLCDFAQVAEGKLFIAGGGWSYTNRLHGYLAVLLRIPWTYTQQHVRGVISLLDGIGAPVMGAEGNAFKIEFDMEIAPNVNAVRDLPLDGPMAIPLPTWDLPKGSYKFVLEVDGQSVSDWDLTFLITEPSAVPRGGLTPRR